MCSVCLHLLYDVTGCWVCFNKLTLIPQDVLSVFANLLSTAFDAMKAGQSTANVAGEELPVVAGAACFAIIDSALKV